MNFKLFSLLLGLFLFQENLILCQNIDIEYVHNFGLKFGFATIIQQTKEVPFSSGRGLGCSISHRITNSKPIFGAKLGIFYQYKIKNKTSLIIGPEVLIAGSNKTEYDISSWCRGNQKSKTLGYINFPNFTFNIPILVRQDISFFDLFIEIGGYHDLGTSIKSNYTYEYTEFRNFMHQPYPEPLVTNEVKELIGSNYGLIFGLGKSKLSASKNIEISCHYYLGLSKTIPLGEYKYISHSRLDFSVNLGF